jgi:hypothetical protein
MAESSSNPNPWHESLTKGYEPGDMRVRWFAVALACFVAFAAVTHWWLWVLVKADANPRRVDRPVSAVPDYARPDAASMAGPPLQPTPEHDRLPQQDLEAMRRGEDKVFEALGWQVDPTTHRAAPPAALVQQVVARYGQHAATHPASAPATPAAARPTVTPIPGVDQGGTR